MITRAWIFAAAVSLAGCSDRTDDEIRANVTLLINQEGQPAQTAADRLAGFGARAIPTIEAAMHTASPAGRKNLIAVLRKIGDAEAVPLLGHIAAFDASPDVRREAEWTLKQWAASGGARGDKAKAALRSLDEQRGREEAG
ncbi:MAG TPA: HEAT repeat domain-containing protein [Polyangia bacterium]|nr:HEAT repeat domain-containing protein [Polyangia bacterium]